ncbi:MAG: serine hydroxymethyltransferase, partial [Nitrospirae bacterium]
MLEKLRETDPKVFKAILNEIEREKKRIVLIASENYASEAVLAAQGSVFTNKYAEGYPSHRYYGGCEYADVVERLAIDRAKELFGAEHVNVQPHSGSQANMAVYMAVLNPGDTIMGMDLKHGGHLTHGAHVNFSGKIYRAVTYGVDREREMIDYEDVERKALKYKPKMIIAGASAYSRIIDFKIFSDIAKKVDAYLVADIAHIAGLIAVGIHPSPIPYADFVTTSTHKTLRGPRGGMIMCKAIYSKALDKMVFPGTQGGPLMHVIAAKAVSFKEAQSDRFRSDQFQTVANAKSLSKALMNRGFKIVSGGTDNHLMLIDLSNYDISGAEAEAAFERAGIILNKNVIPYDSRPPTITSGIRIGTPAVTTRGMKEEEMEELAGLIKEVIHNIGDNNVIDEVREYVERLCKRFPIYEEMSNTYNIEE